MQSKATTPEQYLDELPEDRKEVVAKIREVVLENLSEGFKEVMCYGMLGYVVPHSLYPDGYHCDPKQALPFMNIASQKNAISLYHMGIYGNSELLDWFVSEYPKYCKSKLDMGKGCVRFKKMNEIPYQLIGELTAKMSCQDWIAMYEKNYKKK